MKAIILKKVCLYSHKQYEPGEITSLDDEVVRYLVSIGAAQELLERKEATKPRPLFTTENHKLKKRL